MAIHRYYSCYPLWIICWWCLLHITANPSCTINDFTYDYTNCDALGQRWRVAVPKSKGSCTGGDVPFPAVGLSCSFECPPGSFLNISSQSCQPCASGSYSLGGGIRFEDFTSLQSIGFHVQSYASDADQILSQIGIADGKTTSIDCPENTGWIVADGYLKYVPNRCVSKLSYTAHLVRPGHVEYVYRMPKNNVGLMLNVVVKNEQCQSYRDQLKDVLGGTSDSSDRLTTNSGEWLRGYVELKTGPNVIAWTVAGESADYLTGGSISSEPILIAHIDIFGVAFTSTCTLCAAGTYSNANASQCTACPSDTFTGAKGAKSCEPCISSTQYSGPRSSKCIDRPKCTHDDYYAIHEPCINGKTSIIYKWVHPKVCRTDITGAVDLPKSESKIDCPPCNPGMHTANNGTCVFCNQTQYSNGTECHNCPSNTIPNYGYQYVLWHSIPPNMETKCDFIAEDIGGDCTVTDAWLPKGDSIQTARTHQSGLALELHLAIVNGFKNPLIATDVRTSIQNPVAHISFVFETYCHEPSCVLYFLEIPIDTKSSGYKLIADYNGTTSRRVHRHAILHSSPVRYMWAFIRSRSSSDDEIIDDHATIYSINVTNVIDGGASYCLPCPSSISGQCIACDHGHYMTDDQYHTCTRCPINTILNTTDDRIGIKSCIPCGMQLTSNDGITCNNYNGHVQFVIHHNQTQLFDFSSLKNRHFMATGVTVFSGEGTSYYHIFNFTLIGNNLVTCIDNYESSMIGSKSRAIHRSDTVEAAICRSTALPMQHRNATTKQSTIFYVSPMILGNRLVAITNRPETIYGVKLTADELDIDNSTSDVYFLFDSSTSSTERCPHGVSAVVTARCDSTKKQPEIHLPKSCPDGTCTGCVYNIIMRTAAACPICTSDDFTEIRGECINGYQTIHEIPAKHCILSGNERREKTQPCILFGLQIQLLIGIASAISVILCVLIIIVCKRNRKLEYKYMKLIETKAGVDGFELPGAESCGLEEDENEDETAERIIFAKGKKRMFGTTSNKNRRINTTADNNHCKQPMVGQDYEDDDDDRAIFVQLEHTDD